MPPSNPAPRALTPKELRAAAEFFNAFANEPVGRKQLGGSFLVKHTTHRGADAVRDAQAVDAWWQRILRAGYRYRSVDRRVDVSPEQLRAIVTTAVRPRERRDRTGRSSARSGDSGSDDGPSEPDGPAPATERGRA